MKEISELYEAIKSFLDRKTHQTMRKKTIRKESLLKLTIKRKIISQVLFCVIMKKFLDRLFNDAEYLVLFFVKKNALSLIYPLRTQKYSFQ